MNALFKPQWANLYEIVIFAALGTAIPFYFVGDPSGEIPGWKMLLFFGIYLLFQSVAVANVIFFKRSGYVILPIITWWRKNGPYEINTWGTIRFYAKLVDYRVWEIYDGKGQFVGWQQENDESGRVTFVSKEIVPDKQPPRMHWLSRLRSPALLSSKAAIIDRSGDIVGHTTFTRKN